MLIPQMHACVGQEQFEIPHTTKNIIVVYYTVLQQKRNEVPFLTIMLAVCDAVSLIAIDV